MVRFAGIRNFVFALKQFTFSGCLMPLLCTPKYNILIYILKRLTF